MTESAAQLRIDIARDILENINDLNLTEIYFVKVANSNLICRKFLVEFARLGLPFLVISDCKTM